MVGQSVRNAVADRVDVDEAVGGDATRDAALAHGHGTSRQYLQRSPLGTVEAIAWPFVRVPWTRQSASMHQLEVRLQLLEAGEATRGERVALHVADALLGLALGASPIRLTRTYVDAPVTAERGERGVDARGARVTIVPDDERTCAVDEERPPAGAGCAGCSIPARWSGSR